MSETEWSDGLGERLMARGEELLGKLVQELTETPTLAAAIGHAFEARSKAAQAQETAIGLLGIPSAADVERLTRRVRALAARLDAIEDALRRIEDGLRNQAAPAAHRLEAIEQELSAATRRLDEWPAPPPPASAPPAAEQERPDVTEFLLAAKAAKAGKGGKEKKGKGD
jgi:uncharacterized membrane protein YccC